MSDYCLRLPKEYAHRLELLGEALHSIHEVVSTAGLVDASSASGIQKPLSTLGYVGLIPESDVRDAIVQGLGPLVFDQDERRRWASWQLEVLLATGMPTVRARAVAADASAALTLLARGYYRGMQQMLHVGWESGGTHVSSLLITSAGFRKLTALDDQYLLATVADGTATLGGLAVQAAAMIGLSIPAVREESAGSFVASLPMVAPVSVAHLRQYLTSGSGESFMRVADAVGRGVLRG